MLLLFGGGYYGVDDCDDDDGVGLCELGDEINGDDAK